jgi:hypothetical protein
VPDAEGAVGRLVGARLEDGAAPGAAAEAPAGRGGRVLGPDADVALDAERADEVRVDGRREPLELQGERAQNWSAVSTRRNCFANAYACSRNGSNCCLSPPMAYFYDFAAVGAPGVAEPPRAVPVAVEDADLAVDGTGGAAVAVGVDEIDNLGHIVCT